MSGLRYATEDGIAEGDAANAFLQNKLKEGIAGRYTKQQYEQLMQNGGLSVVNASDGAIPGGEAYPKEGGTMKYMQNDYGYDDDKWNHSTEGEVGFSDEWGDGYAQQIKASGQLDDSYVKQFEGLSKGDSAVDDDGEWRTLKSAKNSEATTKEDFKKLAEEWKAAGFDVRVQDLDNSQGAEWADIAVRKGPGGKMTGEEGEAKPIEHSPEIRQAVNRVRTYENDVMSGKLSNDIFGGAKSYGDYSFDHNKGGTGIGTKGGVIQDSSATKATQSFLNNKSADVKKEFNFKPA